MKERQETRYVNKYLFILISIIIFIITNFLIIKGINLLDEKVLVKLLDKYQILYLVFYNLIWIIINVIELILLYKLINKLKLKQKDINLVKNINIISFVTIITIINIEKLNTIIFYNISLVSIMILLQTLTIWYLTIYIIERKYKCDRLKLDLLSLIISVLITFVMIFVYEYIEYQKTTIICTRENNDIAYIRLNEYGVENIKINGEYISDNDLLNYNLSLLVEFLNNINKYEDKEELIKQNIQSVISYEKNNKSTCKTIR